MTNQNQQYQTIHCVGIGGIGLSALAQLLAHDGYTVSGSDKITPAVAPQLAKAGVTVSLGFAATHIPPNTDLILRTLAADDDNPELVEAVARGIPIWTYAQGLGWWARDRKLIAVAGTHGKSTTTALLGSIFIAAGLDPTVLVGSRVPAFGGNAHFGSSDIAIVEADEYGRSFLQYHPHSAIVTNIDWDHVDTYPSFDDFRAAFQEFVRRLPKEGTVVLNAEDAETHNLSRNTQAHVQTFGLQKGDVHSAQFPLQLKIPGRHNQANALAAAAMAKAFGIEDAVIIRALENFQGLWRRQEVLGQYHGATIISDYAHHPKEIEATLEAMRSAYPHRRMIVLFQPHRRKRLREFLADFQKVLRDVHPLIIFDVYEPPGEDDIVDVTSQDIIPEPRNKDVFYASHWAQAHEILDTLIQPNDVVILLSAGDYEGGIDHSLRALATPS